jgi:cyclopropane fatty-acyl-phospholipid synthase-like methyltransferase
VSVPERIRWAVELLRVGPEDRILEIGAGPGVSVSLVCEKLEGGKVVAIDRSATAAARSLARNREHVGAGRAEIREVALEDLEPGERFDKILAVNVNLFWTRSPARELELLRSLLRPGGALYLVYEPPGGRRAREIVEKVGAALEEHGLGPAEIVTAEDRSRPLVALVGRPS